MNSSFVEKKHPRLLINICTHGNEVLGLYVMELLKKHTYTNGSITFNIGNPLALEKKVRFIESDLNRSFPGSPTGTYEEKIAYRLMSYVPNFDYVIDIHSTVSGIKNCLIIEDDSEEVQKMISVCTHAETVLHMTATKDSSFFASCRLSNKIIPALAFEYGDNGEEAVRKTYEDILAILHLIGVLKNNFDNNIHATAPKQFECYKMFFKKETDVLSSSIKNYELVLKGGVVGFSEGGDPIFAPEDFYPVLFGETNYKTLFGFMGRKV